MTAEATVRELRSKIDHPVVDGDGHIVESWPVFFRYLAKVGGSEAQEHFVREMRERPIFSSGDRERGEPRMPWWGTTTDTRDLATVMLPRLLYERVDELGLDFVILYPSLGLVLPTIQDEKARRMALRALNTMNAEITADFQDRMTAVAMIPMHTPEEAVDEIEYVTEKLGTKVAVIPAGVTRPIPALHREYPDAFPSAYYFDCYGLDSLHDYSPVWEALQQHRLAVTAHGAPGNRYLPLPRRSPTNYMYNHIMGHAFQQVDFCLSLVMGGAPKRFPELNFGFLEGGAGWACDLLHGLHEHFEKRNAQGIRNYDPARIDRGLMQRLFEQYGRYGSETLVFNPDGGVTTEMDPAKLDEFRSSLLERDEDLAEMFGRRFYFGCEADDRSVYRAMDGKGNPFGLRLKAFFSSDIGHWDVPDITEVLIESHQLVDEGLLSADDYRDFVFTNPALLHAEMNPDFFDGTPVESAARELLQQTSRSRTSGG
ncbi:MAG: amidohydrolase family protein [Dehalococcoidia bacterium]|nr:amidohydrolase family protein [Dehalococcoidia bacterium]